MCGVNPKGAIVISCGNGVGIAVVDWLVLTIGLQLMHTTSTQSTIIASLPFRHVCTPSGTFGLEEEVWCYWSSSMPRRNDETFQATLDLLVDIPKASSVVEVWFGINSCIVGYWVKPCEEQVLLVWNIGVASHYWNHDSHYLTLIDHILIFQPKIFKLIIREAR